MKKLIPLAVLSMIPCLQLFAQEGKLKTVQATSVFAPANVKVDGSLKEWDDTFQAYNKTTKIFYTLCNDDKYLYFIVKSIDIPTSDKIVGGGITLNINTEDKKKDKDVYSITFPNIPRQTRGQGGGRGGAGGGGGGRGGGGGGGFGGRGPAAPDSAAIAAKRKMTVEMAKEIKVLGFKDITDTLISIYNEFSIKAGISYDPLGNYGYEMAVPLKLLNLSADNAKEFAYHIIINGLPSPPLPQGGGRGGADGGGAAGGEGGGAGGGAGGGGGGGGGGRGGGGGGRGGGGGARGGGLATPPVPGSARDPEMYAATDFWGKYTLAKK